MTTTIYSNFAGGVNPGRFWMIGGNLGMKTALLPEYADDAAAGAAGVIVGQWYRTGSTIKQRVS